MTSTITRTYRTHARFLLLLLEEKECPDDEDGAGDSDDDFEVDEDTYQFYRGPAELYTADGGPL